MNHDVDVVSSCLIAALYCCNNVNTKFYLIVKLLIHFILVFNDYIVLVLVRIFCVLVNFVTSSYSV